MSEPFNVPVPNQICRNTPQLDLQYLSNCMLFREKSKEEPVNLCQILESSFDGIYITDGSAITIFVNHSYESITGLNRDEVLGKTMQDLVKNKIIDKSGTLLALKNHGTVTLEQKFRTGKRAIITSTPSYAANGKPVMVVTNVRDITELHDLKEQLAHEKELTQKQLLEIEIIRKQFFATSSTVTADPIMLDKLLMATKVAKVNTAVLLLGETGVGKEKIAAYIHQNSPRRDKRFITINCGSISEQLAESELFGYEPGAFTGANIRGKLGLFEVADQGTLFLDEIGELPMDLQVKLLRVIQEQEVLRVGSTLPRKIDVRIIAATNQNLEDMVAQNRFRRDLFYRLNVFPLYIPPLRERTKDILPLSHTILEEFNKQYGLEKEFTQDAEFELQNYSWPGNIRELRNIIERAIIISTGNEIFPEDLTLNHTRSHNSPAKSLQNGPVNLKQILEDKEAEYIRHAYKMYKNIRRAATCLAMNPATFLRKLRKYQK
ncbi:MAG: sigma 54-interacting transcriptional regulator [Treponema sp.]|nr:sigma 54-interacting transcriptional regulator [Treponema sp.]